jgi:hypothetical protein
LAGGLPFSERSDFMTTARPGSTQDQGPGGGDSAGAVDQVKQAAGQAAGQATDKAGQLIDQAQQQVTPQLEGQKARMAGNLGTMAGALRQTSQQLRGQDQTMVAQYLDQAAQRAEQLAGYLQERRLADLVDDVGRFAQRQPALFLTAAFGAGLLVARFLKSSSDQGKSSSDQGDQQFRQRSMQDRSSWSSPTPASQWRSPEPAGTATPGRTVGADEYRPPAGSFEGGEE